MAMKINLVYPDVSSFHGLPYHPGLASVASFLKSKGHDVKISYFKNLAEMKDSLDEICAFAPDIVGFTGVETQFRYVKSAAAEIKKRLSCMIVCGGPYASLAPQIVLGKSAAIDVVIAGEGEYAMAELARRLEKRVDWKDINNLVLRGEKGDVIKNPLYPVIESLDLLPYPSRELFAFQDIIDRENIVMFHFNRGCPYHCAFCSNEALGGLYGMSSNKIRFRSVESAILEIEDTLARYKVRDDTVMHLGDDLFIYDKEWFFKFCDLYQKRIGRPFWCTARSNHMTEEICAALKKTGCIMLMMSVESGNDYIRNSIMNRNISRETLFKSFDMCSKHGINTLATCIIGLPFETPEMIDNSIKTMAELKSVIAYGINTFYPYYGTRLRRTCEENGFMPDAVSGDFLERKESILNLPALPKDTLAYYYRNWARLIMRNKTLGERLKFELRDFWNSIRKTSAGRWIRAFVNHTAAGSRIKRYIMRHVWNRVSRSS